MSKSIGFRMSVSEWFADRMTDEDFSQRGQRVEQGGDSRESTYPGACVRIVSRNLKNTSGSQSPSFNRETTVRSGGLAMSSLRLFCSGEVR